jgi:hypothetical protein
LSGAGVTKCIERANEFSELLPSAGSSINLGNGNNIRDDQWTQGIAVGSKGFVEHVKSALGALAKGRKAKESGDSYQLREPSAPYGEHFGVKNEDIGLKNTYLWNYNPE